MDGGASHTAFGIDIRQHSSLPGPRLVARSHRRSIICFKGRCQASEEAAVHTEPPLDFLQECHFSFGRPSELRAYSIIQTPCESRSPIPKKKRLNMSILPETSQTMKATQAHHTAPMKTPLMNARIRRWTELSIVTASILLIAHPEHQWSPRLIPDGARTKNS